MIIRSLYNVDRQMNVLQKKQENNAANIANINTVGYKYQELVQSAMKEYELHNYAGGEESDKRQELGSINFGTEIDEAYTDFSQGDLKQTGMPTDFAMSGKGFFAVRLEDGTIGYTRNGNFKVNNQNKLITQEGYEVLGKDQQGQITGITVDNNNFEVGNDGLIKGSQTKLMAVDFPDYGTLEKRGNGIYVSTQANFIQSDSNINQGVLEMSNADMLDQMVNMMQVSREFQSNQRVLKTLNDTLDKTVNEIGRN